jgi:hypothetical protein
MPAGGGQNVLTLFILVEIADHSGGGRAGALPLLLISKRREFGRMNAPTRKAIPKATAIQVLTEAGYRCAVPTCRQILALDIHHIVEVSEGGDNNPQNLLPLCPTCHALFHRGTIARDAIYAWKAMIVSLSHAFDTQAIDDLLFLANPAVTEHLQVSGDGVIKFSRLIGAGLAAFDLYMRNGPIVLYRVGLTEKGAQLIRAWQSGNRQALAELMGG